jgi:hypothetical protein
LQLLGYDELKLYHISGYLKILCSTIWRVYLITRLFF